jgi:hypothetical protein
MSSPIFLSGPNLFATTCLAILEPISLKSHRVTQSIQEVVRINNITGVYTPLLFPSQVRPSPKEGTFS